LTKSRSFPPTEDEESKKAIEFYNQPSIEAKERFRLKDFFWGEWSSAETSRQKERVRRQFLEYLAKLDTGVVNEKIIQEVDKHLES